MVLALVSHGSRRALKMSIAVRWTRTEVIRRPLSFSSATHDNTIIDTGNLPPRSILESGSPSCRYQQNDVALYPHQKTILLRFSSSMTDSKDTTSSLDTDSTEASAPLPSSLEQVKLELLDSACTNFVHQHGWTNETIVEAAATLSGSSSLSIAGTLQPSDLIRHCMIQWNQQLRQELDIQNQKHEPSLSTERSRRQDLIVMALQRRLEMELPYIQSKTWSQAMALGAHPNNVVEIQSILHEMIDIVLEKTRGVTESMGPSSSTRQIVHGASERVTLGAVFVATELHLLSDTSPGFADTWTFLRHRVEDWECLHTGQMPKNLSLSGSSVGDSIYVTSAVASAFVSGVASLLQPAFASTASAATNTLRTVGIPLPPTDEQLFWNSIFGGDNDSTNKNDQGQPDGTDPRHYEPSTFASQENATTKSAS